MPGRLTHAQGGAAACPGRPRPRRPDRIPRRSARASCPTPPASAPGRRLACRWPRPGRRALVRAGVRQSRPGCPSVAARCPSARRRPGHDRVRRFVLRALAERVEGAGPGEVRAVTLPLRWRARQIARSRARGTSRAGRERVRSLREDGSQFRRRRPQIADSPPRRLVPDLSEARRRKSPQQHRLTPFDPAHRLPRGCRPLLESFGSASDTGGPIDEQSHHVGTAAGGPAVGTSRPAACGRPRAPAGSAAPHQDRRPYSRPCRHCCASCCAAACR